MGMFMNVCSQLKCVRNSSSISIEDKYGHHKLKGNFYQPMNALDEC